MPASHLDHCDHIGLERGILGLGGGLQLSIRLLVHDCTILLYVRAISGI